MYMNQAKGIHVKGERTVVAVVPTRWREVELNGRKHKEAFEGDENGSDIYCWVWGYQSNQPILRETNLEAFIEGLRLKLKRQKYFGHLMKQTTHWKTP